nr:reverse transcriptase domain-containing protein [Tanacetum cinerariifolium]
MRTRSSSNLLVVSFNPSTLNPKRRNRRRSKQPFILEEYPIDAMADQRTMAELLRAPTEGLEKDNPHDHIRWFNTINSTIKYKDVPNSAIKLTLFSFSLTGAARRWLEKEPSRSTHTWEDLVSKFINEFFPPSRTTNLRNEISNFQQRFDELFHEAWDRYKDLLRACPHHEIAKLTHAVNQQTSAVTTAMTVILKQFQATPPSASVKAIEKICFTCGGAHPYYQCLTPAVILKKLPEKLGDPRKFLIPYGFSELKCKSLADLVESDTENVYDDPFDSKGEKIKESKLLIDELDPPCDFLPPEYDLFLSEDFSWVDALPSTNNEDKVFNSCILIQENLFEIITHVSKDKKLDTSNASLMLEDFDPPIYELPFLKEVPRFNMLLSFSSENEEKVFKPGIHTSEKVHSSLITELSHQGYKVFKINQMFKSPMNIFLFSCGKDTHILVVTCLHFYPLDQFKYGGIGSS